MSDGAMPAPDPQIGNTRRGMLPVSAPLLARVLEPYRQDCRYLLSAQLQSPRRAPAAISPEPLVALEATCHIPSSCYIDDTGHFNAVELNITYNQLLYTALAIACRDQLVPHLSWDLPAFYEHQLPDVLILDYHATFTRPLDPRAFSARFEILKAIPKPHKRMLLIETHCKALCDTGGQAETAVVVALLGV